LIDERSESIPAEGGNPNQTVKSIKLYKRGSNEVIDSFLEPDEVLYIVQGVHGRRPILADTRDKARDRYLSIPYVRH
jgi:hypothetical protein